MSALRQVLVVDDDPVVGKSFNRVLSQKGYVVVTAENAAEALEKMREQEYDVVFSDIKMPGMSGIELAEEIKARRPWTPVVIVTGYGSTDNQARAKAAGVSAFLNKPLSPEMIEESAAQALLQTAPVAAVPLPSQAANEEIPVEVTKERSRLVNIALFLAAPFIGLVYAMALPAVGMAMLLGIAGKALARKYPATRNVGLVIAAPFIGLIYVVTLPFVGLGMLLWTGFQAFKGTPSTK
ncbi:MAG: response regulator [Rhodoferax sp.]|nr:response regulator [Rhodoferax sp.]MCF8208205.1 response regulator [Rhodoferax sp.]